MSDDKLYFYEGGEKLNALERLGICKVVETRLRRRITGFFPINYLKADYGDKDNKVGVSIRVSIEGDEFDIYGSFKVEGVLDKDIDSSIELGLNTIENEMNRSVITLLASKLSKLSKEK